MVEEGSERRCRVAPRDGDTMSIICKTDDRRGQYYAELLIDGTRRDVKVLRGSLHCPLFHWTMGSCHYSERMGRKMEIIEARMVARQVSGTRRLDPVNPSNDPNIFVRY